VLASGRDVRRPRQKPLETLWEVPDGLWERIEPILLEAFPPAWTGRSRAAWRRCLNGIIYQLRTGCQWNYLPRRFGSDRTVHRWFTKWVRAGVFERIWGELVAECDALGDVHWEWQAADGWLGKARMGGDAVGRKAPRRRRGAQPSLPTVPASAARGPPPAHRTQQGLNVSYALRVAWAMYERLGFERSPDLDFRQEALEVFGLRQRLLEPQPPFGVR
jgi:transposase